MNGLSPLTSLSSTLAAIATDRRTGPEACDDDDDGLPLLLVEPNPPRQMRKEMDPLFPFYASHLLRNRSRSGSIQQLSLSLSVQSRRYFRFSGCKSPSLTSWRDKTRERARRRNCLVGEKEKEDPFSRALIAFSSSLPPRDFNSNCVVFDPFPHSSRRAVKIGAIKWTLWR